MSLPRDEQETSISWMRDDAVVRVFTSNRTHLDLLRKLASSQSYVTEVSGSEDYATFEVEASSFYLFSAVRAKRVLSAEARAKSAESLVAARAAVR